MKAQIQDWAVRVAVDGRVYVARQRASSKEEATREVLRQIAPREARVISTRPLAY